MNPGLHVLLLALTLAQSPFAPAPPEEVGLTTAACDELVQLIGDLAEAEKIVGAELLIIKQRRTVLHEAFGWKDRDLRRPMVRNTLFNVRSMAKPLVGATAQILIDEDRLAPDDRVADFLPSFAEGPAAEITIAQLLSHRSGLPDGHPPGPAESYSGLREVADYWGTHGPSQSTPGERFLYSDPGADVLGAVIAEATGQPLSQVVARRLLRPLGMRDSFAMTDANDPRRERVASNYRRTAFGWTRYWQPGDEPLCPFVLGSGTTWYATPVDYARFLALWLDEGLVGERQLLSKTAVRRALTPVSRMNYPNSLRDVQVNYGQMWQVYTRGEQEPEVVAFGHSGSDGTYAWVWPAEDLMVLYFTQSRGQRTRLLLEAAVDRLLLR